MKKVLSFFFGNFGAKITCLLLASSLWVYVGIGQTKNAVFPGGVPLQLRNVPKGLAAIVDVKKVQIRVVAENDVFKKLSGDSFAAYLDLGAYEAGTYDVKVTATTNVHGIQIVETDPATVIVRLEPKIEKEVPINILIEGKAGEGMAPGQWQVNPNKIKVSGARSIINSLSEVSAKVTLDGETSDLQKIAKVFAEK